MCHPEKNDTDEPKKSPTELERLRDAQLAEMLGDTNRWFAGEALGHKPTAEECIMYYVMVGAAKEFRKRWEERKNQAKTSPKGVH